MDADAAQQRDDTKKVSMNHPAAAISRETLDAEAKRMTDSELDRAIASIRGNPKRAGSRARRLSEAEVLAYDVLTCERVRRNFNAVA